MTTCTRCEGSGFLNIQQVDKETLAQFDLTGDHNVILKWIAKHPEPHDVTICDCCGDGESVWYGTPGEHYGPNDPPGRNGPYGYNGGLCECH